MSTPTLHIDGLHASIVGSATVLNDGISPNTLTIALTNGNMFEGNSAETDIVIKAENKLALYFIADDSSGAVGKDQFKLNWALSNRARIQNAKVHLYLPGDIVDYNNLKDQTPEWTLRPGKAPEPVDDHGNIVPNATISSLQGWELTPAAGYTLKAGESLLVVISNIITDLPDGPSLGYMLLQYGGKNHFTKFGPVQKTPNFISGNRVGIGTNNPGFPLSIGTQDNDLKIALWDGGKVKDGGSLAYGFGLDSAALTYYVANGGKHKFRGHDPAGQYDLMTILANYKSRNGYVNINGSLSIGTPNDEIESATSKHPILTLTIGDPATGLNNEPDGSLSIHTGNAERMRITADGKVGIGVGDPVIQLALGDNDTGLQQEGDGNLAFFSNNQEYMRLTPEGNLGIQTKSPIFPLSISPSELGAKISLWDNGNSKAFYGLGISPGQLDYYIPINGSSHAFYNGGPDSRTELFRVMGTGDLRAAGKPLIKYKRLLGINNPADIDTGISAEDYLATVAGLEAFGYDIREYTGQYSYTMYKKNGTWHLKLLFWADTPGIWNINVIAFNIKMVEGMPDYHGPWINWLQQNTTILNNGI